MIGVKELIARKKQVAGEVDVAIEEIKAKMELIIDDGLVESADRGLNWFTTTLNPREINDEIRDLWYQYQEKFSMSKYDLIMEIVKKYRENGFRVSREKTKQDFYKFEFLEPRPKLDDETDETKEETIDTGSQTPKESEKETQTVETPEHTEDVHKEEEKEETPKEKDGEGLEEEEEDPLEE